VGADLRPDLQRPGRRRAAGRGRAEAALIHPAIAELASLTWEEARDLDRAHAVAILPIGAVEAHGPHLPLGTDTIIALAMARAGATRLAKDGMVPLLLPPLSYSAAPFAAGFPGTLSVSPATLRDLVVDVARELTRLELRAMAVANAHLDPAHLAALKAAAERAAAEDLLPLAVPDLTRRTVAQELGEEFRSGACHAGRYETSIVMAERPAQVREEIRQALPANPASLSVAIRAGLATFEQAGGPRAYFGWPADASADEGRATVEVLGGILADAVREALALRGNS
jgi:creatinine amidohydrolase